jgi:hypothetical protein
MPMRLPRVEHDHRLKQKLLIKFIGLVSKRRVPDVIRTLLFRPEFFGALFSELTQSNLRGPSPWTVGEREMFASFTAKLEACHF